MELFITGIYYWHLLMTFILYLLVKIYTTGILLSQWFIQPQMLLLELFSA